MGDSFDLRETLLEKRHPALLSRIAASGLIRPLQNQLQVPLALLGNLRPSECGSAFGLAPCTGVSRTLFSHGPVAGPPRSSFGWLLFSLMDCDFLTRD